MNYLKVPLYSDLYDIEHNYVQFLPIAIIDAPLVRAQCSWLLGNSSTWPRDFPVCTLKQML